MSKVAEAIAEEKAQRKFLFQFINHENGQRSKPFVSNWEDVRDVLENRKEGEMPTDKDYLLLVAVLDEEETTIPATPLITVKTYLDMFTPNLDQEQQNG